MKYIIKGGKKLSGKVQISGNKNSALPCIAAALLTNEDVVLENIPDIKDVSVMIQILTDLGAVIKKEDQRLVINCTNVKVSDLPEDKALKLRASILLLGPLLARFGKVSSRFPGGDVIGRRSIKVHLDGFTSLGASLEQHDLKFKLEYPHKKRPTKNITVFLEEASTTGTENIILTSCIGEGVLTLRNCPSEPQIVDLCQMLILMGAKIEGVGTDTLKIEAVPSLTGATFRVSDDYLEIATYAIAGAITNGKLDIICDPNIDLEPTMVVLRKFGIELERREDGFTVKYGELVSCPKVVTNIWPGFPTDLVSAVIVLATQAKGVTLCHDWMYESRMFFVDKLISMGAHITIADPHRVLIYGPTQLRPRDLDTPDIRAGVALVLAALVSDGTSYINRAELIERGYEDPVGKLKSLGADIERIS